ncbi:hypothetical protein FACS1894217_10480 [Clostridia bacterium]|nr:hypothetical protein FACS1894217_10480 [Clostridia bacterium]
MGKIKKFAIAFVMLAFVVTVSIAYVETSLAYSEDPYIASGYTYFIKNAYSGKYLAVEQNTDANATNVVQQVKSTSNQQKWKVVYMGSGLYKIISMVGAGTKVLDVHSNYTSDGANIDIYADASATDRRFAIERTATGSYKIMSQCSNYTKTVTVMNASCDNGYNVIQWTYNGGKNDEWIFEPVNFSALLGQTYATNNWDRRVPAYPDTSDMGGDCTDFASQCLLASGIHFFDDWKVDRKNNTYPKPTNTTQLNNSWTLTSPSPWISANTFRHFWINRTTFETYTGSYILAHKSEIYNRPFYVGDIIQIMYDSNGVPGNAWHTMYITSYGTYNGNMSFQLTYHTVDTLNKNLLQICAAYPSDHFRFFRFKP